MSRSRDGGILAKRLLSVTAVTATLVLGSAGAALAAPGNGHSSAAPGQVKKSDGSQTASNSSAQPGKSDHSQGNAGTSGDPSQPQPVSNADQNGGGANGQCPGGPYCSTRDGSPSGNGNGNGKATGKPCAGCVGKADNKNPKGQMPNGSDHNAGYECDRNHGIGRTNPAHTGCTSSPPPCSGSDCQPCTGDQCQPCQGSDCTPCDAGQCPPPCQGSDCQPNCEQTNTCPCPTDDSSCKPPCQPGMTGQECGPPPCGTTQMEQPCTPPPPACVPTAANHFCSHVKAVHHNRPVPNTPPGSTLPFTGSSAGMLMESGIGLLALGSLAIMLGRRRKVKA